MNREMQRVTLKMIAERANTSIGTVDRALNNREGISDKSKQHVLRVAEELGYKPNKFASALSRKKIITIGIIFPNQPSDFYQYIEQGVDRAAAELMDYNVIVEKIRYEYQDPDLLNDLLQNLNTTNFEGLAINSAGPSAEKHINRFVAGGLPVATFNTDAKDSNRLFYVGGNSQQSGMVGGELLSLLHGKEGHITILGNFAQATPFIERFGGFCEYIQQNAPDIRIYPSSNCRSNPDLAARQLIELIEQAPDITGVFCTGFSSTVGAVQALRQLRRKDISVVGYDITNLTADALREGWCNALLYQAPQEEGYQVTHLMARHILEGWLPANPRLHIETQIVLRSNIDSYWEKIIASEVL